MIMQYYIILYYIMLYYINMDACFSNLHLNEHIFTNVTLMIVGEILINISVAQS